MSDYITKLVHLRYNPDAQCPRFRQFLSEILPESLIAYVQAVVGYALTGDTTERVLFIFYGSGNNGKSTLLAVIHIMIEEYSVVISPETLMTHKNQSNNVQADLANLQGARFVRTSECEDGMVLSQAKLKALTQGYGSRVHACRKYENPFDFEATGKVFIDTNPKPAIHDPDDRATFKHLHAVPFLVTIPDEQIDPDLGAKLEEELEGILAWAVEGARLWYADRLAKPPEVEAATAEWRDENDNVARFIHERCELGDYYTETASRLYASYKTWTDANKEFTLPQKKFARSVEGHGYRKSENKYGRRYHGVRLKELSPDDAEPRDEEVPF
jgi:putative DNA primase/helicase